MVIVTPVILLTIAASVFLFIPDTSNKHKILKIIAPIYDSNTKEIPLVFILTKITKIVIFRITLIIDINPLIRTTK